MHLLDRSFDVSVVPVTEVRLPLEDERAVEIFLYREAQLLDDRRLDEWLALWSEDGRYWIPRFHNQKDPFEQISLFWEDKMLRETRVLRLEDPRNWSQQPKTRASHLIGNVAVVGLDASGLMIVRSSLNYTEWRCDQRAFAGTVHHKLEARGGGWRIALKRIDLINCDGVLGNFEVFI